MKITNSLDFQSVCLGDEKQIKVFISNTSTYEHKLLACKFQDNSFGANQFYIEKHITDKESISDIKTDEIFPICILSRKTIYLNIICRASLLGRSEQKLLFEFGRFSVERVVRVNVHDPSQDQLMPSKSYQPKINHLVSKNLSENCELIKPEPPFRKERFVRLASFPIPGGVRRAVRNRSILEEYSLLTEEFTAENYARKFHLLLYLEELQKEIEMKKYRLNEIYLQETMRYIVIKVPGLTENRPSLTIGDRVILTKSTKSYEVYQGYIYEVCRDKIRVRFHSSFHSCFRNDVPYDVEFHLSRTAMKLYHKAIKETTKLEENVLFPSNLIYKQPQVQINESITSINDEGELKSDKNSNDASSSESVQNENPNTCEHFIKWYNPTLNDCQKIAVSRILIGECRSLPYIVFGPPGTGKTITVVESILQIFKNISTSRILVCTPSNSAADLIVKRLAESKVLNMSNLVRYNSFKRLDQNILDCIKPYCKKIESINEIIQCRIIVCTLVTAGSLRNNLLKENRFTHLFIDEAGQSTEPEAMIAIGLVSPEGGQVVLAGDPLQLGPTLCSSYSKKYGLQISYLERIMSFELYQRNVKKYKKEGHYNPLLVTKLIDNYRSHPAIISLSSDLFYNSELKCCAPKNIREKFCQWKGLPKQHFPLFFHGIRGENFREESSPSWFNPSEAIQVVKYFKELLTLDVTPSDVGIITPYRKQIEKIRYMMSVTGIEMCKVGSIEEFQGQERLIIIISVVRTYDQVLDFDAIQNLGFLTNPKRFNVAITRAQALLIIIGDPYLLIKDEYWKHLINYCLDNNAYYGCVIDSSVLKNEKEQIEESSINSAMKSLNIN